MYGVALKYFSEEIQAPDGSIYAIYGKTDRVYLVPEKAEGVIMMNTLKKAFLKKYDHEVLRLGFKRSTGTHPYYVRIINNEILHIITFRNLNSGDPDYGLFTILGGIATVYRKNLNLSTSPNSNIGWLKDLSDLCVSFESDLNKRRLLSQFAFRKGEDDSLQNAIENSYTCAEKFLLSQVNEVITLDACINWFERFQLPMHVFDAQEMFGNNNPNNDYNEGILYVKVKDLETIKKKFEQRLRSIKRNIPRFYSQEDYDLKMEKRNLVYQLDEYSSDLFVEIENELERRKANNLLDLKKIGLM